MVSHRPFSPEANPPSAEEAEHLSWVYVLQSLRDGIYYVGSTDKGVEERLRRHNKGDYRFTKGHRPWKIIHFEEFSSVSEAIKRERFLKTGVGRQELKKILACSK